MDTIDDIFVLEFNRAIREAPRVISSIQDVPVPDYFQELGHSAVKLFAVQGVSVDLFQPLEGTEVLHDPSVPTLARTFDKVGKISEELRSVTVPYGSLAVLSDIRLPIPYGYSGESGYSSVDHTPQGYLYILPKEVLHPIQKAALAISTRKLKSYFSASLRLRDFSLIYLSIIPYRPGQTYTQTRILAVKDSTDFSEEITALYEFWVDSEVCDDVSMYSVNLAEGNLLFQTNFPDLTYNRVSQPSDNPLEVFEEVFTSILGEDSVAEPDPSPSQPDPYPSQDTPEIGWV